MGNHTQITNTRELNFNELACVSGGIHHDERQVEAEIIIQAERIGEFSGGLLGTVVGARFGSGGAFVGAAFGSSVGARAGRAAGEAIDDTRKTLERPRWVCNAGPRLPNTPCL